MPRECHPPPPGAASHQGPPAAMTAPGEQIDLSTLSCQQPFGHNLTWSRRDSALHLNISSKKQKNKSKTHTVGKGEKRAKERKDPSSRLTWTFLSSTASEATRPARSNSRSFQLRGFANSRRSVDAAVKQWFCLTSEGVLSRFREK